LNKEVFKMSEDKKAFDNWYERFFCQSPRLCALKYDDEKMFEAWKVAYKIGLAEGAKMLTKDEKIDT
jgi:hypothetical protein